jgi:glycosyltransferase involved in cell wall biosynthesis
VTDTLRALPVVFQSIRKERADFTFIYGWTTWTFFLLWPAFLGHTRAGFVCMLDTEVNGEFRRAHPVRGALFEYGVRKADVRFAITQYQVECFARNGLDCTLYRPLVLPRTEPLTARKEIDLLWIARCHPIKRPHLFLDLAERLPDARCVMVSPNENAQLFRSVEARAHHLPNVEFRERVPYHQVQALYDRARVFVNTSTWEGFANSFVQSGQGQAAILSLAVDTDHVLERFNAGWSAGDDFDAFVARARRLLAEPDLLRAQQLGAARFVREWHDNGRNVDAFLSGLPK